MTDVPTDTAPGAPPRTRLVRALLRLVLAAGWLVAALAVSVGGAGLVAAISHPPGTAAREELTWAADRAIRPGLLAAGDDLAILAEEVDRLGRAGRGALAALSARDSAALTVALEDGSVRVARAEALAEAIRADLAALPGVGPGSEGRLGWGVRAEYARIDETLRLTSDLRASWARLTTGSAAAERLTSLLARHDAFVLEAVKAGSTGRYREAIKDLARATVRLDAAEQLRDAVRNTSDVSTLDQWIARNRAIDEALRELYDALLRSKGRVTPEVRRALAAEKVARNRLPPDTRGLVVIMADLARGGLNQAVIAIEEASRGLAEAVEASRAAGTAGGTDGGEVGD